MVFKATQGATWRGFVSWRWDKVFPKEGVLTLAAFPSNAGPGPQKHKVGGAGRGPTHSPQLAGVAPLPHHSGPG